MQCSELQGLKDLCGHMKIGYTCFKKPNAFGVPTE